MKPLLLILVCVSTVLSCAGESKPDFDALFQRYRNMSDKDISREGQELLSRNSMDSAMAVFTILANRHENPKTQEAADYACMAHNCLGMICFMNSNYSGAYSHFSAASELWGEGDAAGNLNLSAIYLYYGDQQRAYQLMRNVFDDAVRKRNYHIASSTMLNLLTSDIDESVPSRHYCQPYKLLPSQCAPDYRQSGIPSGFPYGFSQTIQHRREA